MEQKKSRGRPRLPEDNPLRKYWREHKKSLKKSQEQQSEVEEQEKGKIPNPLTFAVLDSRKVHICTDFDIKAESKSTRGD